MGLRREKVEDQVVEKVRERIETRAYSTERDLCVFHLDKGFRAESYERKLLKTREI